MMIAALFLMIAQANDANAQRPGMDPEMRAEFARMAAQKVAGELKLDKAEREWFEPLYMEYADSLRKAQKVDLPEKNKEIKEMTDDEAVILMVDSNLQRENLLPSEKAFAYQMKLEAMKHQGKSTSCKVCTKSRTDELIGQRESVSARTIQNYIRLTHLVPPLLQMVDDGRIAFSPAVEVSYLTRDEQTELWDLIGREDATPSLSQALRMKRLSREAKLTPEVLYAILTEEKPNQKEQIRIKTESLRKYFPRNYSAQQMEREIIKLLEARYRAKGRGER